MSFEENLNPVYLERWKKDNLEESFQTPDYGFKKGETDGSHFKKSMTKTPGLIWGQQLADKPRLDLFLGEKVNLGEHSVWGSTGQHTGKLTVPYLI